MIHRRIFSKIAFLLLLCLLFEGFGRGTLAMTVEEEKKLGKRVVLEMEKKVEWVRDLTLRTYLERLGHSLVAQIGPSPFDFKFYLINGPDPNAFAIPGGYIFVTTGLLALAEDEQEVAGVLSHEIAHVMQRHVAQLIEKSKRLNIATFAAILAGVLLGGGGAGSEAAAAMATATAEALALKYTREMETDADQNGFNYMVKAGYDPNGLITFLSKIYKIGLASGSKVPPYLLTHPAVESRISLLENLLQAGGRPKGPFKTSGNFRKIQVKAFVEEKEPHVAIAHFQSLVENNPKDLEGYYGLGLAYRKTGRLDRSLEALQKARALAPNDTDTLRELGIVYFLSGKLDQAIENLETIEPTLGAGQDQGVDLLGLYYLGRAYQEKGEFARALPLFLKIQKEAPEFVEVYHSLGSVYGRMGQKGLSHFYFGKHFKLKGEAKNALLHFRTAFDLLERGSPEREEAQREIKELSQRK
ncbi:MAG: M48 family metalloprotease [Syntrophaceae bacterium]|nr:M48 family metalloprotease [Syntrophaceae bacterium]